VGGGTTETQPETLGGPRESWEPKQAIKISERLSVVCRQHRATERLGPPPRRGASRGASWRPTVTQTIRGASCRSAKLLVEGPDRRGEDTSNPTVAGSSPAGGTPTDLRGLFGLVSSLTIPVSLVGPRVLGIARWPSRAGWGAVSGSGFSPRCDGRRVEYGPSHSNADTPRCGLSYMASSLVGLFVLGELVAAWIERAHPQPSVAGNLDAPSLSRLSVNRTTSGQSKAGDWMGWSTAQCR